MTNPKRTLAALLCGILLSSPILALCEQVADKNEIVYVTYSAAGEHRETAVVNRFEVAEPQYLTDYGAYSSVQNLTTTEAIEQTGDTLGVQVDTGIFYYEGIMDGAELPWDIRVRYLLGGVEVTPEALAGQAGDVEIILSFTKNPRCREDYFDHYALNITMAFDTENCASIRAEGGTIANVGKLRQVSYIILPETEKEQTLEMRATQFAMDPISINAVPLSMDIGEDQLDTESIKADLLDLEEGASDLDEGALILSDGADELMDGADDLFVGSGQVSVAMRSLKSAAGTLSSGSSEMSEGIDSLAEGAVKLSDSHEDLADGIDALADRETQAKLSQAEAGLATFASALPQASGEIKTGVAGIEAGAGSLAAGIQSAGSQLATAAAGLDTLQSTASASLDIASANLGEILTAVQGAPMSPEAATILSPYVAKLAEAYGHVNGVNAALSASGELATIRDGVSTAATAMTSSGQNSLYGGVVAVKQGASALSTGVDTYTGAVDSYIGVVGQYSAGMQQLNSGAQALANGIETYVDGAQTLYDGVFTLQENYVTLDDGIGAFTGGVRKLTENYAALDEGVQALVDGIDELVEGVTELTDGTLELRENTTGMDVTVDEKVQEALDKFRDEEYTAPSFTSAKNQPSMVQFVMKIDGISIPEAEDIPEEEIAEEKTFFQKLKDLF